MLSDWRGIVTAVDRDRYQRRDAAWSLALQQAQRDDGKFEVELISGTMPPRQALWEDSISSKRYFQMQEMGGNETNSDGHTYASLGGGLKRWRVAKNVSGVWVNRTMPQSASSAQAVTGTSSALKCANASVMGSDTKASAAMAPAAGRQTLRPMA